MRIKQREEYSYSRRFSKAISLSSLALLNASLIVLGKCQMKSGIWNGKVF